MSKRLKLNIFFVLYCQNKVFITIHQKQDQIYRLKTVHCK